MGRNVRFRREREQGFVLAWLAVSLTVLVGLGGASLDLGNWYLHVQREQNAVDAAALAGAVFLPTDPNRAVAEARKVLSENGFTAGANAEIEIVPMTAERKLKVNASTTVTNVFLNLVGGKKTQMLSRSATATHAPHAGAVDPGWLSGDDNVLGREPTNDHNSWLKTGMHADDYYVDIEGGTTTDIAIHVASTGKPIDLEIINPAFVNTGRKCNAAWLTNLYSSSGNNSRFEPGETQFCNGDHHDSGGPTPSTTYTVYAGTSATGSPVKWANGSSCTKTYAGHESGAVGDSWIDGDIDTVRVFREASKATRICEIPATGQTTDYTVRITTTGTSESHHGIAVRAGVYDASKAAGDNPGFDDAGMTVKAKDALPAMFWHDGTVNLLQIPPTDAGTDLEISLDYFGDTNGTTTVSFTTSSGASFANCTWVPPGGVGTPSPNCTFVRSTGTSWNNGTISFTVSIPASWTCDMNASPQSASSCWIRANVTNSLDPPNSSMFWHFADQGPPIRLVK
jgi:hypothetical protein